MASNTLRSAAERAASVERMPAANRDWFAQAERLHDADRLRKVLTERHVPLARRYSPKAAMLVWAPEVADYADARRARIDRICKLALERMRKADAAFSARNADRLLDAARLECVG